MEIIVIKTSTKQAINSLLEKAEEKLCVDEEVRIYFTHNAEVFDFIRKGLRNGLRGVALIHTSPKRIDNGLRHYGLDFIPDDTLRNTRIVEVLRTYRQL